MTTLTIGGEVNTTPPLQHAAAPGPYTKALWKAATPSVPSVTDKRRLGPLKRETQTPDYQQISKKTCLVLEASLLLNALLHSLLHFTPRESIY